MAVRARWGCHPFRKRFVTRISKEKMMMKRVKQAQVVRLTSQLPCSIDADEGRFCGVPARVALAMPGKRPGSWQIVPVCYDCVWDLALSREFDARTGFEAAAAYAVPPGITGDYHLYELRRPLGKDERFAVINIEGFGVVAAAGPLSDEQVEVFQATQVAPWDEAVGSRVIDEQDQYAVIWSQCALGEVAV